MKCWSSHAPRTYTIQIQPVSHCESRQSINPRKIKVKSSGTYLAVVSVSVPASFTVNRMPSVSAPMNAKTNGHNMYSLPDTELLTQVNEFRVCPQNFENFPRA